MKLSISSQCSHFKAPAITRRSLVSYVRGYKIVPWEGIGLFQSCALNTFREMLLGKKNLKSSHISWYFSNKKEQTGYLKIVVI